MSSAERDRLRENVQAGLGRLAQELDGDIGGAARDLLAPGLQADPANRHAQYANRYRRWRDTENHSRLLQTLFLADATAGPVRLLRLKEETGSFESIAWPPDWSSIENRIAEKLSRRFPFGGGIAEGYESIVEVPYFGSGPGRQGRPRELEWLIFELDIEYLRSSYLPEMLQLQVGLDYEWRLVPASGPARWDGKSADASIRLLDLRLGPERRGLRSPPRGRPAAGFGPGKWMLLLRHRSGSLEAVVQQTRMRNLAVSGGILLLIVAAMVFLLRTTERARNLAALQMDFVAGVSHELRTPLTVMRTAGHNLQSQVANDPGRVRRYGELVESESIKLTAIVERVLQFSNAKAGRVIAALQPVSLLPVIASAIAENSQLIRDAGCVIEQQIDPDLSQVMGDSLTLLQAVSNLVSNAAKYGAEGGWIGVFATNLSEDALVEIRVANRGPAISADEADIIFEPFYRGQRAISEQIHGTGLGLSLTRQIVEAHHGQISVRSQAAETEFSIRLPASRVEQSYELSNTAG